MNQTPQTPDSPETTPNPNLGFRLPLWAKFLLMLLVVLLGSIGYFKSNFLQKPDFSRGGSAELDSGADKRPQLEDFDLLSVDGKKRKFSDYKGQVVILSFWASWCTPCLVELPVFAKLEERFGRSGLRIVPVNVDVPDTGRNFAKDFWKKNSFEFPNYIDADHSLAGRFSVDILPSNFVIDRQGRLVFSGFGANDWTGPEAIEFLEGLLGESSGG